MKKIIYLILFSLVSLILLLPAKSQADGAFFPPSNFWVRQSEQKAVIIHQNNLETLILSVTFFGDAKDFAWLIPTPSRPEVDKGQDVLFTSLEKFTQGEYPYYERLPLMTFGPPKEAAKVEVLETKKVDIYEMTVLKAGDKEALYEWLNKNGYFYPEAGKAILEAYIKNHWFFTAIKINTESLSPLTTEGLREGHATPIKLTFPSKKIVYPLKISSLLSEKALKTLETPSKEEIPSFYQRKEVTILLYILADHKKEAPAFQTLWASWVKPKEIKKWATDDQGNPWFSPSKKFYLTKLYRSLTPSQMKEDLFIFDASDNKPVGQKIAEWSSTIPLTFLFTLLILLSPFGLLFIICALCFTLLKNRVVSIVSQIVEILILLAVLSLALLFKSFSPSIFPQSLAFPFFLAGLLICLGMLVTLIWQIKKKV